MAFGAGRKLFRLLEVAPILNKLLLDAQNDFFDVLVFILGLLQSLLRLLRILFIVIIILVVRLGEALVQLVFFTPGTICIRSLLRHRKFPVVVRRKQLLSFAFKSRLLRIEVVLVVERNAV